MRFSVLTDPGFLPFSMSDRYEAATPAAAARSPAFIPRYGATRGRGFHPRLGAVRHRPKPTLRPRSARICAQESVVRDLFFEPRSSAHRSPRAGPRSYSSPASVMVSKLAAIGHLVCLSPRQDQAATLSRFDSKSRLYNTRQRCTYAKPDTNVLVRSFAAASRCCAGRQRVDSKEVNLLNDRPFDVAWHPPQALPSSSAVDNLNQQSELIQ